VLRKDGGTTVSKRASGAFVGLVLLVLLVSGCASGSGGDQVEFEAILNGTEVSKSAPRSPVSLVGADIAQLELKMTNVSDEPVTVRYIRFEGEVIDMIFLTYDTAVRVEIAPGETETIPPVLLDFYDLGGQASGYLRGHVQLYDEDREIIGSEQMFLNASGDGFSTLSLFNVLLLIATAAGAAWNLLRLAQRRLPANRFVRAMRFLAVGAGAGLTLAVAFSTLRIYPLGTLGWLLFTIIGSIIGYLVGFVLPGGDDELIDVLDEHEVIDAVLDGQVDADLTPNTRAAIAKGDQRSTLAN